MTIGNFYADDDIVFGKGLVDSYLLESEAAIYPRIIMTEDTFQQLDEIANNPSLRSSLDFTIPKDHDGVRYLNYYRWVCPYDQKYYDPVDEQYQEVWSKIDSMRNELISMSDKYRSEPLKYKSKLDWAIGCYNDACRTYYLKNLIIDDS